MLHLLPEQQKKKVLIEYRIRLTITVCLSIIILALLGTIMLLPAYAFTYNKYVEIKNAKVSLDANITLLSGGESSAVVNKINEYIAALAPLGAKEQPSMVFDRIISHTRQGIRLTHFTYDQSNGNLKATIGGVAAQRSDLTSFITRMQGDTYFEGVFLPLSSYTKDKDIDFTFPVVVKGIPTKSPTQ